MTILSLGLFVAVSALAIVIFTGNIAKDRSDVRVVDERHKQYNDANDYIRKYGWISVLIGLGLVVVGLLTN